MIYDCFTFYDELDLLELRLETLDAVVDRFVLCEAPFTFRGEPKPLAFAAAAERFARWRDRITALVYPHPASANAWVNEWGQRDHLIAGLAGCADDDLVLIGDVDEIPDPADVARRPQRGGILGYLHRSSEGWFNRVIDVRWLGTRALAAGDVARYRSLSDVRKYPRTSIELIESGWHFTSLGGAAARAKKLRATSHAEVDLPYFRDLHRLEVTFGQVRQGRRMEVDATFPAPLRDDPRWAPYLWAGPTITDPALVTALEHAHGCLAYVPDDAASVAAVTADPHAWNIAGERRFGTRWAGDRAARWVVLDRLERLPAGTLDALGRQGANVVAFAANARSFASVRDVLAGGAFGAGAALGLADYHARFAAAGYAVAHTDLLLTDEVFVAWPSMPEVMYGARVGPFEFREIARETLRTFLATAFIFVLERPPNEKSKPTGGV